MDSALDGKSSDKEEEDLEALPMAVARRGSRSLRHSFVDPKHRCCITFQVRYRPLQGTWHWAQLMAECLHKPWRAVTFVKVVVPAFLA